MINPTPKEAKPVLTIIEPAQYMRLVRVVMGLRSPEEFARPMTARRQLQMYVYEWLVHLGFLEDDKIRWLMQAISSELAKFGAWLDKEFDNIPCVPRPIPSFLLTVTDRRYAVWPGQGTFADLQNEEFVRDLDQPGCTHIVGDFLSIFTVKQKWLKRLQGGKDAAGHQHHAGAADAGASGQDEDAAGGAGHPPG